MRKKQEKEINETTGISKEQLAILSKVWEEDRNRHRNLAARNRDQYFERREEIFREYNGKYIAFGQNEVLYSSNSLEEVERFAMKDSTIFVTEVGNENYSPSSKDVPLS
jgi:hypothetical protein